MKLAAMLIVAATSVHAADADYCTAYARGAAMTAISPIRGPLTYPQLDDIRERAFLKCLNIDEGIDEADSIWVAHIINDAKLSTEGTTPATGKPADVAKPVVVSSVPRTATASPGPAQVCARAHRRIVWQHNKSWRCQ